MKKRKTHKVNPLRTLDFCFEYFPEPCVGRGVLSRARTSC